MLMLFRKSLACRFSSEHKVESDKLSLKISLLPYTLCFMDHDEKSEWWNTVKNTIINTEKLFPGVAKMHSHDTRWKAKNPVYYLNKLPLTERSILHKMFILVRVAMNLTPISGALDKRQLGIHPEWEAKTRTETRQGQDLVAFNLEAK